MNDPLPSNWGAPELVEHRVGSPNVTTIEDTLTLLFDGLVVELRSPPSPLLASASVAVSLPWRLAGRTGLTGFTVDVRGFAEGDGAWLGDLVLHVGGTTRTFDLRTEARGDFIVSFLVPPWFDAAEQEVSVLFSAHLTVQRSSTACSVIGSVDSIDIKAQFPGTEAVGER